MKNVWHESWGRGSGRVKRLAPQTRILCGTAVFATGLAVPLDRLSGWFFLIFLVVAWILACRPPAHVFRAFFVLGLVLFLPYLLLAPLIRLERGALGWDAAFLAVGIVAARGQAGLLITTATLSALSLGDLRQGLLSLPIPRLLCLILLHILHQAAELYYECRRIAAAMAVRGAAGRAKTGWRLLVSLPTVWLPRVMYRAERAAAAMEIRQYGRDAAVESSHRGLTLADWGSLAMVASVLFFSLAWRKGGM